MLARDLEKLTDEQFDGLMEQIRRGERVLSVTLPNLVAPPYDNNHFKEVAKEWGVEFFHHLVMTDPDTGKVFTTPLRYMVIQESVIRLTQMIEDKQSIPDDSTHVDDLTGQVTGPSKGSRISFTELNNIMALNGNILAKEMITVRGGDEAANQKLESDIALTGEGRVEDAIAFGNGVTSTKNFATLLRSAMLNTTLDKL